MERLKRVTPDEKREAYQVLKRVAGVEPFYLPSGVPPAHDSLPWACATCG